jgi:outer membrane protein, heavy metal efflux system
VQAAVARQMAQLRALIAEAADASATLAQRYYDAGNLDALALAREQASAEQARLDRDEAASASTQAESALRAAMGLAPAAGWTLDERLPAPVADEASEAELLALAQQQRLDRAARQRELTALDGVLNLAHTLRWLPFVSVGVSGEREPDGNHLLGPAVAIEIPLFGKSETGLRRAESERALTAAQAAALDTAIAHDIADARQRMETARLRLAALQTRLLPAREAVVARTLERQNYMLASQFELLAAKQQEYDSIAAALAALRDYWLARIDLHRAVGGALPGDTRVPATAVQVIPALMPPQQSPNPEPMP